MLQPYQILFPIGLFYALWGAGVWIVFLLGWAEYPGQAHASLMISGFLFSFASGFLMTAVPRFTGSPPARRWEIRLAVALSLVPLAVAYAPYAEFGRGVASMLVLLFLCVFFFRRFRSRAYSPPPHFVFVPLGLLLGLLGSALQLGVELELLEPGVGSPARILVYQAVMLCLCLGVGGKLVSALLGWGAPPLVRIERIGEPEPSARFHLMRNPAFTQAGLVLIGFLLELTPAFEAGRWARAIAASWIGLSVWKLHRRPSIRTRLANWLWVSAWGLVIGVTLYAAVPRAGIHALHIAYICGFGLMTFMIASRVTLAHGGYPTELEQSSKSLTWAGGLIAFAALTRSTAPWTPSYFHHLGYAGAVWCLALLLWAWVFLPKILRSADSEEVESAGSRC